MNRYTIEKLKEGRVNANLKQSDVAKLIGIKGNALSNYENGMSEPSINTFCASCDIYNIDASNILKEAYELKKINEELFKIKPSEIEHIKKYRIVSEKSPDAAKFIDTIVDRECKITDNACQQLQIIIQDKQKRLDYEAREKAVRDHNQMMFETEQRGIEIVKKRGKEQREYDKSIQIAKNMIQKKININTIIEITGLSITDIEALQ